LLCVPAALYDAGLTAVSWLQVLFLVHYSLKLTGAGGGGAGAGAAASARVQPAAAKVSSPAVPPFVSALLGSSLCILG
jgi:hypothetical protein